MLCRYAVDCEYLLIKLFLLNMVSPFLLLVVMLFNHFEQCRLVNIQHLGLLDHVRDNGVFKLNDTGFLQHILRGGGYEVPFTAFFFQQAFIDKKLGRVQNGLGIQAVFGRQLPYGWNRFSAFQCTGHDRLSDEIGQLEVYGFTTVEVYAHGALSLGFN